MTKKITETTISIKDMEIYARHGVMEQERTVGNDFRVSVALNYDATCAMEYDDPDHALNYAEVVAITRDIMNEPSLLIEHVVARLIDAYIEAFPSLRSGTVSVTKVHPPINVSTAGATFTASFTV